MKVNPSKIIFHQDALDLFTSEIRRDIRYQQKFQQCSTFSKFSILDLEKHPLIVPFKDHLILFGVVQSAGGAGVPHFRFLVGLSCFVLGVSGPEVGKITSG